MDGEEQIGVGRRGWGPHGSSGGLKPERVAESKDVVPHDDGEGLHEGGRWDFWKFSFMLVKIVSYLP